MGDFAEELKQKKEMDPSKHDGSYELVTAVVKAYGNVPPEVLDFHDLNCVYLMTVGTWRHSYEKKKDSINESHILDADKTRLVQLIDEIQNKAKNKQYENRERDQDSCGMFGTGINSFKTITDNDSVQRFVKLCLDILPLDDESQLFDVTEATLKTKINGMEAASISQVLHCLKPFVFPILNKLALERNLFARMGVESKNFLNSDFYVANCRKIKEFRDKNFNFKNYRIIDLCGLENKDGRIMNNQMSNYVNLLKVNNNIILHGAPGTGKTYLAKEIAKAMEAECEMVQFHQSYDYTDFVEGLRPVEDKNGKADGFERKDGAFKVFCEKELNQKKLFGECWNKLIESIRAKVNEGSKLKIGNHDYDLSSENTPRYVAVETQSQYQHTCTKQNIYDTYLGLEARPSGGGKIEMNEILAYMKSNLGLCDAKKCFVFIIDEINRGEMSKIFGELFFSIDPGYRGTDGAIRTQYANMQNEANEFDKSLDIKNPSDYGHFFVPENVYIIGTMNDIDRSVESMDFAMRRRFAFKEVTAEDSMDMFKNPESWKDSKNNPVNVNAELGRIENRMKNLNDAILKDEFNLSSAYQIGAAYFLKFAKYYDGTNASAAFNDLWNYHLEGVLKEYLRGLPDEKGLLKKLKEAYDKQEPVSEDKKPKSNEG